MSSTSFQLAIRPRMFPKSLQLATRPKRQDAVGILSLPRELLDMICRELFAEIIISVRDFHNPTSCECFKWGVLAMLDLTNKPCHNRVYANLVNGIVLCNKALYQQTIENYYCMSTFEFENADKAVIYMRTLRGSYIRHLQIQQSPTHIMTKFTIHVDRHSESSALEVALKMAMHHEAGNQLAKAAQTIEKLQRLNASFVFRSSEIPVTSKLVIDDRGLSLVLPVASVDIEVNTVRNKRAATQQSSSGTCVFRFDSIYFAGNTLEHWKSLGMLNEVHRVTPSDE